MFYWEDSEGIQTLKKKQGDQLETTAIIQWDMMMARAMMVAVEMMSHG